ncbi:MAG: FISUMP domain-containing protein, partial [Gammaproteobacteria bacterium]
MKAHKLIILTVFSLLFACCKATQPTAPSGTTPSLLQIAQILDTTQRKFFLFADLTNGDPAKSIILTANWLNTQSSVASADVLDSTYINIVLKSGVSTTFYYDQIDADSVSIYRGGGSKNQSVKLKVFGHHSQNTITNKKVLIYAPVFNDFYTETEMQHVLDVFANSSLGLDITLLKNGQCTYQIADQFKDYGLVIIDAHGEPDKFITGQTIYLGNLKTEAEVKMTIDGNMGPGTYDKLLSGDLNLSAGRRIYTGIKDWNKNNSLATSQIWINSKYINKLSSLSNTVIFGNMCYSGWNTPFPSDNKTPARIPIASAFIGRNPISYYGYAFSDGTSVFVSDLFAKEMEDTLVSALVIDFDSTGIAHLNSDNAEFYDHPDRPVPGPHYADKLFLKHFANDTYSYESCGGPLVDMRDGKQYKTVCIGNQTWMAENLNYDASGSVCYNNDPANCAIYGRLYDWNTIMQGALSSTSVPSGVQGVCPKGWHVPSKAEFDTLMMFLGG